MNISSAFIAYKNKEITKERYLSFYPCEYHDKIVLPKQEGFETIKAKGFYPDQKPVGFFNKPKFVVEAGE